MNKTLASVVSILPVAWRDKAKSIVAAAGVATGIAVQVWPNHPAWVEGVVTVLTALGVYAVPNLGYTDPAPAPKPTILGKA